MSAAAAHASPDWRVGPGNWLSATLPATGDAGRLDGLPQPVRLIGGAMLCAELPFHRGSDEVRGAVAAALRAGQAALARAPFDSVTGPSREVGKLLAEALRAARRNFDEADEGILVHIESARSVMRVDCRPHSGGVLLRADLCRFRAAAKESMLALEHFLGSLSASFRMVRPRLAADRVQLSAALPVELVREWFVDKALDALDVASAAARRETRLLQRDPALARRYLQFQTQKGGES
jgi:hypothetical protein